MVATLHGYHKKSAAYSYETLYALVKSFRPDYVGVEIRPEDMHASDDYLASMYPTEMIHEAHAWGPRAFGFDWLGDDVAGKPVPGDWWTQGGGGKIKKLGQEQDNDPAYQDKRLDGIQAEELKILQQATPEAVNSDAYDRLNDEYYAEFGKLIAGSRYAPLEELNRNRDREIGMHVVAAIAAHPDARFAILTGAAHRSFLLRFLQQNLGDRIRIVPVKNP